MSFSKQQLAGATKQCSHVELQRDSCPATLEKETFEPVERGRTRRRLRSRARLSFPDPVVGVRRISR